VIIPLTTVMGMAFVFNFPAWRALITDLVPREHMLNGIALDAAQFNLARSVGPQLGALILNTWGAEAAFYINGAGFLAVILAHLADAASIPVALMVGGSVCTAAGLAVTAFPSLLHDAVSQGTTDPSSV
jgi:MFS family permease